MARKIFVTLPVRDLAASKAFFGSLGFAFNPQFTGESAACVAVSDDIHVMLLTHAKFAEFSPHPICDATKAKEVLISLSCDSRAQVDDVVAKAVAAGGQTFEDPQDHGFMYAHSFLDPDGHGWNWVWMDPAAARPTNG